MGVPDWGARPVYRPPAAEIRRAPDNSSAIGEGMCAAPRSPSGSQSTGGLDRAARLEALERSRILEVTGHPALSHLARLAAVAFGASAAFLAAVDAGNALLLAGHVGDGTDDESAWTPGTARAAGVLGWVVQANGAVAIRDLG